jgi:hypothetical protein
MAKAPVIDKGISTNSDLKSFLHQYTDYSIMHFPSWKALEEFALKVNINQSAITGKTNFKEYINRQLSENKDREFNAYGINGKQPRSYNEAMERKDFVYLPEYLEVKNAVEKMAREWIAFSSEAETERPKLVFNDKEIGEFVFAKAAMALLPKLFYYSPSKKREIDIINEQIVQRGDKMYLKSDDSLVVFAYKVKKRKKISTEDLDNLGKLTKRTKKIDGDIYNLFEPKELRQDVESQLISMGFTCKSIGEELWVRKEKEDSDTSEFIYIENKGEDSLKKARKKGLLQVKSSNKKVYLYKEKKPKVYNTIKIIVGLTAGGFTDWINDFYTGVTAVVLAEILESLGYCVGIEVAVGGGRCQWCSKKLNFNNKLTHGRRFFTFTAKEFGEQLDRDGLLMAVSDPAFHNIKWISLFNNYLSFFDDEVSQYGNPSSTWHGIEKEDMVNPIGQYHKALDWSKGNRNLLHFYVHKVGVSNRYGKQSSSNKQANIQACLEEIKSIVLTTLNVNKKALEKFQTSKYDYGLTK